MVGEPELKLNKFIPKGLKKTLEGTKESFIDIKQAIKKKDMLSLKEVLIKNKHKIAPIVSLVRSCVRDAASMREVLNIADYVDLAFSWKENYDEAMGPQTPSSYFDNEDWQPIFNVAFHEFLIDMITHAVPKSIRMVKSAGTASAHIAEIDGFKFGWAVTGDRVDYFCIERSADSTKKAFKIIEQIFWQQYTSGQVIVGVEKDKLSIKEDLSHKEFIKFKKCTELADYVKQFYEQGVSRSILFYGPPGCHRLGQKIIMANGTLKKVEDIVAGDQLLGINSDVREVLELRRGFGTMAQITPIKGQSFVVNLDHILTLDNSYHPGNLIDVSVKNWLRWSKNKQHQYKLIRASKTEFNRSKETLEIDPYFLGILLGDGSLCQNLPRITSIDSEIVKELKSGNKFIPEKYLTASINSRQEILAGLLDTDGHLNRKCFDYISKSKQLAQNVVWLTRSLGLSAYCTKCIKKSQTGAADNYYRVSISGDTDQIPTRITRKQSGPRKQIKNVLRTGFSVQILSDENFYGFTLDGDGRYFLDDFTITHNSGKSNLVKGISFCLGSKSIRFTELENLNNSFVAEMLRALNPDAIILEDIDHNSNEDINDLLDKLEDVNNQKRLIFATANEVSKLDNALLRPGRFDEVMEINKLDEEILKALVNDDAELLEITRNFPVAFTVELLKRIKVLGKEKALANMDDITARIENLEHVNYELRLNGPSSKIIGSKGLKNY